MSGFMWRKVKDENGKLSDKEQEVEEKLGDPLWQKLTALALAVKAGQEAQKRGYLGSTAANVGIEAGGGSLDNSDW